MDKRKIDALWYKDAILYELHVKAFCDSNGDGRGDFRGLIEKLDYIQELGVTAIWLLPFYPSPQRDDGYDISDFRGIHPDSGSLRHFRLFVREAHRRGLRIITELVVNHTSDQHPWFQAARRARPGSSRRSYYVWSDSKEKYADARIIFTDTESSNWTWDPTAGAYYWHRFFSHQPDLNYDNPQVVRALIRVLRYWLEMGVDGLRLDAIPYLCEREGTNCENLPETHEVIKQLRREVDANFNGRMLLAEANQWPEDVRHYFGDGNECHMAFHFPLMPRIFMALRQEDRRPITDILTRTPAIPESCQWALFLRNHDELTLEMVTDEERDYMYNEYAKDPRMRINVGIRRRLAPLLDNSRRRIELLNSLLFSFPGTPVIYYGDEIGMGDNIYLGDRDGVRTPMHWNADRNAGFSRADPAKLYLPLLMDPVYGYQAVNVEMHERNPDSLLHFMRRIIGLRRQHKAFGRGTMEFLHPKNRKVLAYLRRYRGEVILAAANLSRFAQPVELDLSEFAGWTPLEMFGHTEFPMIGDLPYFLTLGSYGFNWFHLEPPSEPIRIDAAAEADLGSLPWMTVETDDDQLLGRDYRYTLLNDAILPYLVRQRWFQGKAREPVSAELSDSAKIGAGFYLTLVRVLYADGGSDLYGVPLKIARGESARRVAAEAPGSILARIRDPGDERVLYDALADRLSCTTLLSAMVDGRSYKTAMDGSVRGFAVGVQTEPEPSTPIGQSVRRLTAEQSNTSVILDDRFILKFFRRIEDGPNPDLEVSRHLTERTSFTHFAPVVGGIEYVGATGEPATLAMAQPFLENQGNGWDFAARLLRDYLDRCSGTEADRDLAPTPERSPVDLCSRPPPPLVAAFGAESLKAARILGLRTAEFHLALVEERSVHAFRAVPMTSAYLRGLADQFSQHARQVLGLLEARLGQIPAAFSEMAQEAHSIGTSLIQQFPSLGQLPVDCSRIRCHGDLHLGQVLRVDDDFVLIDFEGEPLRSLSERREKFSALKDVAGMLRSFAYVARAEHVGSSESPKTATDLRGTLVRAWETWVSAAYLCSYIETASGAPFLPSDPRALKILLDAYILNKLFYELQYELNNRPNWVWIPLEGILMAGERAVPE